jgi:hypothetical protein
LGIWLFLISLASFAAQADVTGYFRVSVDIIPQTTSLGSTPVQVDFQNDLTFTLQLGYFGWNFHGHGGVTGLEDIITSLFIDAGGFRIEPSFVMAQAFQNIFTTSGFAIPSCLPNAVGSGQCDLFFVSTRLLTSLSFGGVTFTNLAIFEDANFPDPMLAKMPGAAYNTQSQAFGFGDVISFTGQTSGGVIIHAATGICAQNQVKKLKKHNLDFSVNPDCAPGATTSLPFFFDFESLSISSVPLASGVLGSVAVQCVTIFACSYSNGLTVTGGPLPFTASFVLSDLMTFAFQSVAVTLSQGAGSLTLQIGSGGTLSLSSINLAFLLNPDVNPARLNVFLSGAPGLGIDNFTISLNALRAGLNTTAIIDFTGAGGSFNFSSFSVVSAMQVGAFTLEGSASFSATGLEMASFDASVQF